MSARMRPATDGQPCLWHVLVQLIGFVELPEFDTAVDGVVEGEAVGFDVHRPHRLEELQRLLEPLGAGAGPDESAIGFPVGDQPELGHPLE
eukprot:2771233-Pyramimonas_sp.AAC.1